MLEKIYHWLHGLTSGAPKKATYSSGYWAQIVRRQALVLCQNISGRAIEIGCGEGLFSVSLADSNRNLEVWGVDNNAQRIKEAKALSKEYNLNTVNLSIQDARKLLFENEFFDRVICINLLFNLDSLETVRCFLMEMKRICKRNGKIIFDIRNSLNPLIVVKYKLAKYYDKTVRDLPLRCYTYRKIELLLEDLGFQVVKKKPLSFFMIKDLAPIFLIEAEKIC